MPPQSAIDDQQKDDRSATLLRGFTAEYRRAKTFRSLRLAGNFVFAVGGPVASMHSLSTAAYVAAGAGVWAIVARLLFTRAEREHLDTGVRIQELFEVRLFQLEWPEALAGPRPSEDDIQDASRRVENDARVAAQIEEGWFSTTADMPWPLNAFLAQWSSVEYGRRTHRSYATLLFLLAGLTIGVAAIVGVAIRAELGAWLIAFGLPALPGLMDVIELAVAHWQFSTDRQKTRGQRFERLWQAELKTRGTITECDIRSLQDDTFRSRDLGLQVPDLVFWKRRAGNETTMHAAFAQRRAEYHQHHR